MDNQNYSNPTKQPILPNENTFNDYDRINDVLLCLKSLLSDYTTFIIECSHQQLANKLIDIQKEVYQIQREVFDLMYSKGWYPLEPETPQKIQKVVQEYTTKESQCNPLKTGKTSLFMIVCNIGYYLIE